MGMGRARRRDNLGPRRIRSAVGDVLGDGAKEQKRLLQHQPDVATIVRHRQLAHVNAVKADRAFADVVKAAHQIDQRALARAAVSHQADHLAGTDVQTEFADDLAVAVAKADPLQLDAAVDPWQRLRLRRLRHVALMIEDVEDALGPGCRLLRVRDDTAHGVETRVEAADVGDEGGEHAHRDLVVGDLPDAKGPDHQQADLGEQGHGRREQRPDLVDPVVDLEVVLIGRPETARFTALLGEGLDHANTRDHVGQHIGHLRPDAVGAFKTAAQAVTHHVNQIADQRQG